MLCTQKTLKKIALPLLITLHNFYLSVGLRPFPENETLLYFGTLIP